MKWLDVLRPRTWHRPAWVPDQSVLQKETGTDLLEQSALADLERKLDLLTQEGSSQARLRRNAEAEVQRFFGGEVLRDMHSAASESGEILFAADRLMVTFLGRRAAMAITRKLYSSTE